MNEMTKTARGWNLYATIVDTHGAKLRVQQSSADPCDRVYLFTENRDGVDVNHWVPGKGWSPARRPGEGDPPWDPSDPMRPMSEGYSPVSPHLTPTNCRELIAALERHLAFVESGQ